MSVDLHIHTTASDSLWTPKALAAEVWREGLAAFAVTDHDTDAALDETAREAEALGLTFVRGVEFSCWYKGVEVHILGYFVDRGHHALEQLIRRIERLLVEGATECAKKMRAAGLSLPDFRFTGKRHAYVELSQSLVDSGEAKTLEDAFRIVIDPKSNFFVRPFRPGPREVIEAIRGSGAVTSLAHPIRRGVSPIRIAEEIDAFQEMGLQAIEVFSPHHDAEHTSILLEWSRERGLGATGGSDNHKGLLSGRTSRLADIPDWVYEELVSLRDGSSA